MSDLMRLHLVALGVITLIPAVALHSVTLVIISGLLVVVGNLGAKQ